MRVGVLGTGVVGRTLATGLIDLGHDVTLGSRTATNEAATAWANDAGDRAKSGTFADAAASGELIVLATLWSGTENALTLAGADNLAAKTVIDCTNPLQFSDAGEPSLALGHDDSGGEQIQRWLPQSHVVKAFNIVGNVHMVKPRLDGGPPTMLIAGNDADAKAAVTEILTAFEWETVDLGDVRGARYLEPLAMAWIAVGMRTGTWTHAFRLLRG